MLYEFRYAKHGPGCYPLDLLWPMAPCSAKCGGCTDLPRNKSRIQRYVLRWFSLYFDSLYPPTIITHQTHHHHRHQDQLRSPNPNPSPPIYFAIQSFHSIHTIQILRCSSTVISAGCEPFVCCVRRPPCNLLFWPRIFAAITRTAFWQKKKEQKLIKHSTNVYRMGMEKN